MHIETLSCPECGTVVAANVLETQRTLKCPGLECERVFHFGDLSEEVQDHYTENPEQYTID